MTNLRRQKTNFMVQAVPEECRPVHETGDVQMKFTATNTEGETFDVTIAGPATSWCGNFVGALISVAHSIAEKLGGKIGATEIIGQSR